jgi:hypothetical protein
MMKDLHAWLELNLTRALTKLQLAVYRIGDFYSKQRFKEHKLYMEPQSRSAWLHIVGLSKPKSKPPISLRRSDGSLITDPREIKQMYLDKLSSTLRSPLDLPAEVDSNGPREFEPPDLEQRKVISTTKKKNPWKPHWWDKLYHRDAKKIDKSVWEPLMKEISKTEVIQTVNELVLNSSPDIEGNTSNLLKAISSIDSPLVPWITEFLNKILEYGDLPEKWKLYYISSIEKKVGKITVNSMNDQLRPISITHEYAKLLSKILANRLNDVLMKCNILTAAQRAFIKNGSTHECITTLINILEDALHKRRNNKDSTLYLVSYDMRKAYDRIQFFSIRPTLERFNMPENFIKYIETTQSSLRACFKTFYGLTDSFSIENSLRQGDPRAPLLFILFTDALM